MKVVDIKFKSITMASVFLTCADLLPLEQGVQTHGYVIITRFGCSVVVGIGLVEMECNHWLLGWRKPLQKSALVRKGM